MNSNTATTSGIMKQVVTGGVTPPRWTPPGVYRITERHKVGIGKMLEYFDSLHNFCKEFKVQMGVLPDGSKDIRTLTGSAIYKHLGDLLVYEVYGEANRDILNGIRECYMKWVLVTG